MQKYCPIRHELAMINGNAMIGNNDTFYIAETNTEAVAQQPYGHKNETFNQEVGVFGEYQCRHQRHYQVVCHMPGISAHITTSRKDNTIQGSMQAVEGGWC